MRMRRTRSSWPRGPIGSKETKTLADAPPQDIAPEPDDEAADHTGPQRRCLVTRERRARETMLRFVAGPDDSLVFDVVATLPGRGMWLSASRDVIEMAMKRGVFARVAGRRLMVPERLADRVQSVLENRIVELLGLARRAGAATGGFEKVKEWLGSGRCALLVEAADGSVSEQARLRQHHAVPVVHPLTAARLGAAFGRERMMHVAIGAGKLAGMIATEAERCAGIAGGAGGTGAPVASAARSGQREAGSG
ncbi:MULTISPECIES: RNA-binding protein [Acidiphilium]|nr:MULTISPECIES: RNA-binding protein [Acidiphilium]